MLHPKVLTREAAQLLELTPAAVRAMEQRGELAAERVSGTRLFDRALVEAKARERSHQRTAAGRREGVR